MSALLAAGQWIVAPTDHNGQNPRPDLAPDIVNNSWGGAPAGFDPVVLLDVVRSWVAAGIFPAFSNGNAGPGCGTAGTPGSYSDTYASGATDVGDAIASFSQPGPAAQDGGASQTEPVRTRRGRAFQRPPPRAGDASLQRHVDGLPAHRGDRRADLVGGAPRYAGTSPRPGRSWYETAIDTNDTSSRGGTATEQQRVRAGAAGRPRRGHPGGRSDHLHHLHLHLRHRRHLRRAAAAVGRSRSRVREWGARIRRTALSPV